MKQLITYATLTVAILAMGFSMQSCSTAKQIEKTQLEGYWALKTLKGEAVTEAFKGSIPSIEFDFDKNLISGSAGCNRYSGGYKLEGDLFSAPALASTMMACVEANKEDLFTQTLSTNSLKVSLEKGLLTFKENSAVVLQFEKGTDPNASKPATAELLKGDWTLIKIEGKSTLELFKDNNAPTITFADNGAVNGNAGCNNYRSNVAIENSLLTFSPLMSTRMACPSIEGEGKYSVILSKPVKASIVGDYLTFTQDEKTVLEFVKTK